MFLLNPISLSRALTLNGNDLNLAIRDNAVWIKTFIGQPHPDLGRPGPVCPHTPNAIARDALHMTGIELGVPTADDVTSIINETHAMYERVVHSTTSTTSLMAVIISPHRAELHHIINECQHRAKADMLRKGHLLGKFHADLTTWSMSNPSFETARSPHPMLATRRLVPQDLKFLRTCRATAAERRDYLAVYRDTFQDQMPKDLIEQIDVEIRDLHK